MPFPHIPLYTKTMSLLTVSHLQKRFNLEAGFFARFGRFVNAVNDVSFSIGKNEAYGLVGESGCGKTTTARLLVRMYETDSGQILYHREGQAEAPADVSHFKKEELKSYREKVRYVFQDPARSLNPRMNVYEILVSGCRSSARRRGTGERELRGEAAAILEEVGLSAADLERRPSEFSGGQRQRISIARGLLMRPQLLICDEVVSALDVSIQGQILNLLLDIRDKRDISFLFIAHDLKVACYFCDRIGVMYQGELMEEAPAANLYREGVHPYTRLLFSSVEGGSLPPRSGLAKASPPLPPSAGAPGKAGTSAPATPPAGIPGCASAQHCISTQHCAFAPRCPAATERCFREHPELCENSEGHLLRCFNA
ncbi:ABC transporter ATP-binding protein [Spirochaetia bacterium]|nr:ABC transporter ATP-binding protein [Spirochaetia bacterium]